MGLARIQKLIPMTTSSILQTNTRKRLFLTPTAILIMPFFLRCLKKKKKNPRQNIALKFKGEERQNIYADFLSKLRDGKIKVKFEDDELFSFFIEDPFVRMTFENLLKKTQGITADYSFNREFIKVNRKDFLTALVSESVEGDKDAFVKALQKQLTAEKLKKLGIKTLDMLVSNLNVSDLFMPIVKTALEFVTK